MLKRFDAAAKAKKLDGRKVIGMWVEDTSTEQGDVPRACGHYPVEIPQRHEAWKRRNKARQ